MSRLNFTKMVGAGNDFIMLEANPKGLNMLAKRL